MRGQAHPVRSFTAGLLAAGAFLAYPAWAEDSTYTCKLIDEPITLIFSADSVISRNDKGEQGKPTEVEFSYSPVGEHRVWSTKDGATRFVLVEGQFFEMTPSGEPLGQLKCERALGAWRSVIRPCSHKFICMASIDRRPIPGESSQVGTSP